MRDGIAALISIAPDMQLVGACANGREAIEQFRALRPDVTLMDLQTPVMSGREAIAAIRGEFPDARAVIDPRNIRVNALPPPVHIEQVVADRKAYDATAGLRLPPRIRDLQIDYTAVSLVAPEKNQFRVKLEGRDHEWQDVGTRRQAFYTDLGPGPYRFRVLASNNRGVWNETGATLDLSIAAAYYQTRWFQAAMAVGTIALLWVASQLRIRQVWRGSSTALWTRVSASGRVSPVSCTTRCCKASTVCCCDSRPFCT